MNGVTATICDKKTLNLDNNIIKIMKYITVRLGSKPPQLGQKST